MSRIPAPEFRRIHLKALEGLFVEVLQLALKLGTMKLGRVDIDGTKIQANASKQRPLRYERMLREEQRLREEVKRPLAEAEQTARTFATNGYRTRFHDRCSTCG